MELTPQQLLDRPECVGTLENTSCYSAVSNSDNSYYYWVWGGFIVFVVICIVAYRLKYGGKK